MEYVEEGTFIAIMKKIDDKFASARKIFSDIGMVLTKQEKTISQMSETIETLRAEVVELRQEMNKYRSTN